MGVEMIKDHQGKDHLVLSNEDFFNDDKMGDKFEDFEILQILTEKPIYGFAAKVRSKLNSKIYAMKKIEGKYASYESETNIKKEFESLHKLNHPNITKYYKYFYQENCLYIIYEFVNNSDLKGFYDAYDKLKRPIQQNDLWNIFMQCISALNYIHSNNIIHKRISLNNIFMTEKKTIKLGDFAFSFLADNLELLKLINNKKLKSSNTIIENYNKNYNKKTDVYAMGMVFQSLSKNTNSEKINDIISLMIKNENERADTEELYKLIKEEYIKHVAKLTAIDSVFRCMFSFKNFNEIMNKKANVFLNEEQTPISYIYISCLQRYGFGVDIKECLNNFRNLFNKNSPIDNDIEIKPSLVLDYLLEKLNKETGNKFNTSLGIQKIIFKNDKKESLAAFNDYYDKNFDSLICQYFVGKLKTRRNCLTCGENADLLYSFNIFPYIEFDLDKCDQNIDLKELFSAQNNKDVTLTKSHNIVCQKCQGIREHREFKQFYSLPENLIITFNRGEGFKNENNINFPEILDLKGNVETENKSNKYNLVGIVKRAINKEGVEYYFPIYLNYLNPYDKGWLVSKENKLIKIENLNDYNNEGMVMLLFYSADSNNIGQ